MAKEIKKPKEIKPKEVKSKAAPRPGPARNKQELIIGIVFVVLSFICVVGVFYIMVNAHKTKVEEVDSLREQLNFLNVEKSNIQQKVSDLQSEVGGSLRVERIVSEADKIYGEEERKRKAGYLWIDRKRERGMATLGVLNGVTPGTRLSVYDGNTQIDYVRVESSLDVIAYVQPINKEWKDFKKDYYRIVYQP